VSTASATPQVLRLGPETVTIQLSGEQTEGRLLIVESWIGPVGRTAPLHAHTADEWAHVLEGEVWMEAADGDSGRYAEGSGCFVPSGRLHAVANRSGEPARVLFAFSPAEPMECFFRGAGRPVDETPAEEDRNAILAVARDCGMRFAVA
jgi:quercetin dioxygenase-like cupin family protein